jgi:hypothetical protein
MRWAPFFLYEVRKGIRFHQRLRHNMYTSTEISGAAAVGYSSGTAIKVVPSGCSQIHHVVMISIGLVYLQRWHKETKRFGCS